MTPKPSPSLFSLGQQVSQWARLTLPCLILSILWQLALPAAAQPPNILFLFSDDQRADTIRALGNRQIRTPNLDRLARQGTAFTQAHIMGAMQGAVCMPSRAMLMSGRTLFRVPDNLKNIDTWPARLAASGYRTFITGKWHNGRESLLATFQSGQAVFLGGMSDQFAIKVVDFSSSSGIRNERTESQFTAELFADQAIQFLKSTPTNQPFCLYAAFTTPHDPRSAPPHFQSLYPPRNQRVPPNFLPLHPFNNGEIDVRDEKLLPWPRTPSAIQNEIADYYASITATDAQIGRILDALDDSGRASSTLIVFAGDNGLALGSHGLLGKQNLYEHSTRVPLILAGPGIPRNQRNDQLCYLLDLAPTLCALANIPAPLGTEGHSLIPTPNSPNISKRKTLLTAYRDVQRAVTDGSWKLIHYPKIDRTQLFDLKRDPHEIHDLANHPRYLAQRARMEVLLEQEQKASGDPLAR